MLLISIDTLRPDRLSCYSKKYLQTPNIDTLAFRGVVFERAFAHTPTTLPSHVNIMVGAVPPFHGIHENSKFALAGDFLTLAECLKEQGYSTGAFIGAFPLDSRFGLSQGFDVYDEFYPSVSTYAYHFQEREASQVIQSAIEWLERQNAKWFSFVHIFDPHAPYRPPDPFDVKFMDDPYSGEVAYVDETLKKLFDFLKDRGLLENTLIMLTGDHGEALGEHGEATHGYFAYNSTLWVPLIITGPGIKPGRIREYVGHIDLFPTVCDYLGIEKPPLLQGISLLPLMKGKKIEKRAIYFESLVANSTRGWAPLRGFIEEKGKFIDSPLPEYYNLENDFFEHKNLVQVTEIETHKKRMRELMDKFESHRSLYNPQFVDRDTRERLRSLGYISSPPVQIGKSYGPEDDLKTLLPFQQRKAAALAMLENNRIPEAVKFLTDIIQKREDFADAYVDLSRIYISQGLEKEALAILETGLANNPENYGIIASYGLLLVEVGLVDKGIGFLQKAIEKVNRDPDVWMHLGIAYTVEGEYQKALEHYEEALSLDRTNALIYDNLGFLHFSIFLEKGKTENLERALECFQRAVAIDPRLPSAYNGLGGAYKALGQVGRAIEAWEKSLELDPDFGYPLYNLGVAYLQEGEKEKAHRHLERYLFLNYKTLSPQERQEIQKLIDKCKN